MKINTQNSGNPTTPKIKGAIAPSPRTPAQPPPPSTPTPTNAPSTPSTPLPNIATGSPGGEIQSNVKETGKVKRKKASLPTNMPSIMKGSFLTNRYIVNNYILLDPLGQGSYAEVRLCKEKNHNQLYAIKIMNKDLLKKKSVGSSNTFMDDVKREIAIMKKLRHEHILQLYEVMDDPKVNKLYLVLEYMKNGDLMQMTKGNARTNTCEPLSDLKTWYVTRQVLLGLKYLHDNDIVHGDIKPQNLLVSDAGVVKIADFGISKMMEKTSDGESEKLLETAGTPAFMSPELCSGVAYDGQLADVYAVGATVYMLRCGHPPFMANKLIQLYHKIQKEVVTFHIAVDPPLKKLIIGMMEKVPEQRFSLRRVMTDPWFAKKPDGSGIAPAEEMKNLMKSKVVEVSGEDMMQSVHQVFDEKMKAGSGGGGSSSGGIGSKQPPPPKTKKVQNGEEKTMEDDEQKRRMLAFKKKASIRQRSFEKLGDLVENKKTGSGNSDGESDIDEEDDMADMGRVSRLDSVEFNSVMDTLAHHPIKEEKKTHLPLKGVTVGKVIDGLNNAALQIRALYHSEQNRRNHQEDRVTVIMDLSSLGEAIDRPYLFQKFAFFGVYDGHSGTESSHKLQHSMHLEMCKDDQFFNDIGKAMVDSCKRIDKNICAKLRAEEDVSGSTAIFVVMDGRSKEYFIANVGDSRAVLSRGGMAVDLSVDHTLKRKDELERVIAAGCKVKDNRVNGVLAVTRSFGDTQHKEEEEEGSGVLAIPEITREKIEKMDEFLILATDGLWDVMSSQQAINFVRLSLNKYHSVKRVSKDLAKEAIKLGSMDNISLIVIVFNQKPAAPPTPIKNSKEL